MFITHGWRDGDKAPSAMQISHEAWRFHIFKIYVCLWNNLLFYQNTCSIILNKFSTKKIYHEVTCYENTASGHQLPFEYIFYHFFINYLSILLIKSSNPSVVGYARKTWCVHKSEGSRLICLRYHKRGGNNVHPNYTPNATVEVWEWISNLIPDFSGHMITYPWDQS